LLLPALGLLCALLRCLRALPSLLRHAALLAVSEWRYRPVPTGIASTALGLLQRDKKTSVFARCSTAKRASTPCLASCGAQAARYDIVHRVIAQRRPRSFSDCSETSML